MENYPENWEEIALDIKAAAGFACENCGRTHNHPAGYTLTVHHLDADRANNDPLNLVALCQRCHLRFQNIDIRKQGFLFGIPEWLGKRTKAT